MRNAGRSTDVLFGSSSMIWDALAYNGAGHGPAATGKPAPLFAASPTGGTQDGRERILDVAEMLFRRFGHVKTTMANIAWELGVSRTTLYRFFPTKEAIEEQVCARIAARTLAQFRGVIVDGDRASDQLSQALRELGRQTSSRMIAEPHLHRLLVAAFRNQWGVANQYIRTVNGVLDRIVQNGLATGEFALGDAMELRRFIAASMLVFIHPGLSELMRFDDEGLSTDLDAHVRAIVRSIKQGAQ